MFFDDGSLTSTLSAESSSDACREKPKNTNMIYFLQDFHAFFLFHVIYDVTPLNTLYAANTLTIKFPPRRH